MLTKYLTFYAMPSPFENHAPYQRIICDSALPIDKQWLRMLNDMLGEMTYEHLRVAGLSHENARSIMGLLALHLRQEES